MRVKVLARIMAAGLVFLLSGLVYTQICRYETYKVMSEGNRLRVTPLIAPRGAIYDRNGEVLVKDILSFNASVIYSRIKDAAALINILSDVLDVRRNTIETGIKKSALEPYSPVCVVPDIGTKGAIRLEEIGSDYPGLFLQVSTKRKYTDGNRAANILGYLGLINSSEFEKLRHYGYQMNDLVGRDGIEKYYDNYLRGVHGGKQVEVDHLGREIATLGYKEPIPGRDVHLTIDTALQKFCHELLKDRQGAIIAVKPVTGAVLAMVSAPSYDPEIFTDSKRSGEISALLDEKKYPLLNRGISGTYPPGSIFKLVIAAGALETRKATSETAATCTGILKLGKAAFHCWRENGHGEQKMIEAIKNSCNVYFYRLGLLLGVDDIAAYAQKFGFGEYSGIDLPGEVKGIAPTRKWKKNRFNARWYRGETVNYAIGQGYLSITPIQITRMISVFANGGYLVKPHLIKQIGNVDISGHDRIDLYISRGTMKTVREGLKKCVNDRTGTGMKARLSKVIVAGKTGTAQTSRGESHGWFGGFAPFDNAKLVVMVFDEYGGKGGYYAAETAGKVFAEALRLGIL